MISNEVAVVLLIAALLVLLLGWWSAARQEYNTAELVRNINKIVDVRQESQSLSVIIDALKNAQQQLVNQQNAIEIVRRTLAQYDQLQSAINSFEKIRGTKDVNESLAAANHILSELKIELGDIHFRDSPQGQILIIKTAPNTFRVTFAVPMRIPPNLTFQGLPSGTTANVIERSDLGFTVVFVPATIPVNHFDFSASAEL